MTSSSEGRSGSVAVPTLWLYGPSGVGKSTIAWKVFTELAVEHHRIGYVDLDQLGMCYAPPTAQNWAPEPATDVGRHRLQARTLNAILPSFAAAGARGVVVSGVVDASRGPDLELLADAALTTLRLRASPEVLRRRLAGRGRPGEDIDRIVTSATDLDRLAGPSLDTTALSVGETFQRVRARISGWPDPTSGPVPPRPGSRTRSTGPGPLGSEHILWVCGPKAVGKSTVGWSLYELVSRCGVSTAFVDLQQIGFLRPDAADEHEGHRLKARNLAAIWDSFRAERARCLVVVGPIRSIDDLTVYQSELPDVTITLCRLRGGIDQLADRLAQRVQGKGPDIAGDDLVNRSPDLLAEVLERATREAEELDQVALGDVVVDTDDVDPRVLAREVLGRTDWMNLSTRVRALPEDDAARTGGRA